MCSIDGCDRVVRTKGMCASHYSAKWNKENRERYNDNWRRYYKRNAKKRRQHSNDLKKLYGITVEDYEKMLEKQNGGCAICGKSETAKSPVDDSVKRLAVDHNHITGVVRGLLCSTCNNGLGCFKDNISLMKGAIEYLCKTT